MPDDDFGGSGNTIWLSCLIFSFSGNLPSDYLEVLAKIDADMKQGIFRLPKEVEDWT